MVTTTWIKVDKAWQNIQADYCPGKFCCELINYAKMPHSHSYRPYLMQALFVDQLTVIDFAYFHPGRGIVGESLILDVTLFGELNQEGMLFDFSFVKKRIKSCVDDLVDHKLLVPAKHPGVSVQRSPRHLTLRLKTDSGELIEHISPEQAVFLLDANEVTPEAIGSTISQSLTAILPENVTSIELSLRPEKIEGPYYHYSHGLKKHFGDCQRIAHGHRSKIEIFENGSYSESLSNEIAALWQDIYLATREDIVQSVSMNQVDCWQFRYHANQGLFQLTIPKKHCYLMESDTTVELIARHLSDYLKQKLPDSSIKVKAFEGVDKGAIATN